MKNDEYQFKDGTSVRSTYERVLNLEPPPFSSDFRPTLLARSTIDRVLRALVSSLSFSLLGQRYTLFLAFFCQPRSRVVLHTMIATRGSTS